MSNIEFQARLDETETEDVDDDLECLDARDGRCFGNVELRPSLTGTGTPIARCDGHWDERLVKEDEDRAIYPDSPNPPDWFDPMAAGERWDDDY